jgi:hypothetical protein
MCAGTHWRYTTNRFSWFAPGRRSLEWSVVSAPEYYTANMGQETAMTPNIATSFPVAAEAQTAERAFKEYLPRVSEVADVRRGIPLPLGTHEFEAGVNFALFSRDATRVRLELEPRSTALLVAPSVTTGGADLAVDHCAGMMGGDDPSTAYAAAMLWYQGYPYSTPKGA